MKIKQQEQNEDEEEEEAQEDEETRTKNDLMTKNRDEEQRKNRGRTKNTGAPIGRLNVGWAIGRFGLQICTKKNAGFDLEEREEEEILKW